MDEQYFCLHLDDYSAPSFVSRDKVYFGTMEDIRGFVCALDGNPKAQKGHKSLIAAFREYEAGNCGIRHNVAYQDVPLLESVKLLGKEIVRSGPCTLLHTNTWGCTYTLRCDTIEREHVWLEAKDGFFRAVKVRFQNLEYYGLVGEWHALKDGFWGFPEMLIFNNGYLSNRLAVVENNWNTWEMADADFATFQETHSPDFAGFFSEIFGNG